MGVTALTAARPVNDNRVRIDCSQGCSCSLIPGIGWLCCNNRNQCVYMPGSTYVPIKDLQFRSAGQIGDTPQSGLWGYDQLPPPGIWRNMDTGDDSTEEYNLGPGRWINSQGVIVVVDPVMQVGPVNIKKPPLAQYPPRWWHMPNQQALPPNNAPTVPPAKTAPAAAADDGLWFGFEPTTLLWVGGGIAAFLALAYLPQMTDGGKK